jgi:predicted GTPase
MAEHQKGWEEIIKEKFEQIRSKLNNPLLKQSLPKDQKQDIENQLERIADKLTSKALKIAVIGEFSAGKSTFLNALLREENLLKKAKRPTTAAVTYIKPGPDDIFVEMKGGKSKRYSEMVSEVKVDDSFKKFLAEYQANDSKASQVDQITLTLDRNILDNEVIIMDTPGFNAGNEEHQRVVERVLKDADAFVAIFSALNPGRKTDLDFMSNFTTYIKKFFFVLNKADLSDEKSETELTLKFLKNRIKDHFSLADPPIVFPLCSSFSKLKNDEHYAAQSKQFERELLDFARTEKLFVILDSITYILDRRVLKAILEHTENQKSLLENDQKNIKQIRIKDPVLFINKERKIGKTSVLEKTASVKKNLLAKLDEIKNKTKNDLENLIEASDDVKKEMQEIKKGVVAEFQSWRNHISESLGSEFKRKELINVATNAKEQFENDFVEKYYKQLKRLQIDVNFNMVIDQTGIKIPEDIFHKLENGVDREIKEVINDIQKENFLDWLWQLIAFHRAESKKKDRIKKGLLKALNQAHDQVSAIVNKEFSIIGNRIYDNYIDSVINEYSNRYIDEIKKWIQDKKKEIKRIKDEIDSVKRLIDFFELKKTEVKEIKDDIEYLQHYTERIKHCDLKCEAGIFQDISRFLNLVVKYQYSNTAQYIFKSIPMLLPLHEYLWGCISIFLKARESTHFRNFFAEMIKLHDRNGVQVVLEAVQHLEEFNFQSLVQTYNTLIFDDSDICIKKALIDITLSHHRPDISMSIYGRHIRGLFDTVDKTYASLIKEWESIKH